MNLEKQPQFKEGQDTPELKGEGQEVKSPEEGVGLEEIRARAEALQARLEEAKRKREEDLEKKLNDREALIKQAAQVSRNLEEAETVLEEVRGAIEATEKAGVEISEEDNRAFKELSDLVEGLREQGERINQQIDALSNQPAVSEKLQEKGLEEEQRREEELLETLLKDAEEHIRDKLKSSIDFSLDDMERMVHFVMGDLQRSETSRIFLGEISKLPDQKFYYSKSKAERAIEIIRDDLDYFTPYFELKAKISKH